MKKINALSLCIQLIHFHKGFLCVSKANDTSSATAEKNIFLYAICQDQDHYLLVVFFPDRVCCWFHKSDCNGEYDIISVDLKRTKKSA